MCGAGEEIIEKVREHVSVSGDPQSAGKFD